MKKLLGRLKPAQILILGFLSVIVLGAVILTLPVSSVKGKIAFLDALFTSTSAVCVTGLVVVDTGTYWTMFGKTVIMILIQIGGLGIVTFATSIALVFGKKITLRNRMLMQESLNQSSLQGIIRLTKYVFLSAFAIEVAGAVLLAFRFVPDYGLVEGIGFSIFHSVSAFCNAGFDIIGNFSSLTGYSGDLIINIVIPFLLISGGVGFFVIADMMNFRSIRKLSLHTKLVLVTTGILLASSFILVFVLEYNNPKTMGDMDLGGKIAASFFQAASPRTAGFNTVDIDSLEPATKFLTVLLMFIGGSPGSTAGGIKTTTFALQILFIVSLFRGKEDLEFANRRINRANYFKSLAVFTVALLFCCFMTLALAIAEPDTPIFKLIFESFSAFGTVGLSTGITPGLSSAGKLIIMTLMFFGRLGALTIVLGIGKGSNGSKIRYPEGKVVVG